MHQQLCATQWRRRWWWKIFRRFLWGFFWVWKSEFDKPWWWQEHLLKCGWRRWT
jgi:hypothetical protein